MKLIGVLPANYSKLAYVIFQILWIAFAFFALFTGNWLGSWGSFASIECPEQSGGGEACFSASGLVRMSWSLAIFSFLMVVVTAFRNDTAAIIHDGWWTLKFLIVAILFVTSFFIPNSPIIVGYLKAARYISVMYLKYQAMHILVLAYVINNSLVKRAGE